MMNPQARTRTPLSDDTYLGRFPGGPSGDPYAAAASRTAVPITNSPPLSHNSTDNSLSSRPQSGRSPTASASHISSSSSVARSSDGAGFFSPATSDFRQSVKSTRQEEALHEHYAVLRTYLAPYLRDEAGNKRTTKARDKLLRLSPTQFNELSTDVYDELRRREDDRRRPGGIVPPSLPPKTSFHPKRNQARQKLSTLPPERFRQLSTDVFYELERRIPRLGEGDRPGSPTGSVASSVRTTSRHGPPNGMRRPSGPPNGMRGPPPPGLRPVGPPGSQPYHPYSPSEDGMPPPRIDSRGGPSGNLGRPLPQTFQSNTMVPNKSTMVEDDETDEEEDEAYGMNSPNGRDTETIKAFESQVAELQTKIAELEGKIRDKDAEIETAKQGHTREKDEWTQTRGDLDMKIAESQQLLETLHNELEQSHQDRNQSESNLRAHTEEAVSDLHNELEEIKRENDMLRTQMASSRDLENDSDWQKRYDQLQKELSEQKKVTDEVRHNAEQFLQEMRLLSEQSELALEKEEQLRSQIASLEAESEEWKSRYAKSRTQLRTLKATSVGLPPQHMSPGLLSVRQEFLKPTGQVNDTDVTNFQISIDERLQAAREAPSAPGSALEKAKDVVQSVRNMTAGVDGSFSNLGSPHSSTSGHASQNGVGPTPSKLKTRVSRDVNNLVTVTRNHAAANGLSPVSLVDAAASNLTTSVIEFVKVLGIRPSSEDGGEDDYSLADGEEIEEIVAPLSTNKSVVVKAPVPPQKQTAGAGWFSMLKGGIKSDDEDDEYDDYS